MDTYHRCIIKPMFPVCPYPLVRELVMILIARMIKNRASNLPELTLAGTKIQRIWYVSAIKIYLRTILIHSDIMGRGLLRGVTKCLPENDQLGDELESEDWVKHKYWCICKCAVLNFIWSGIGLSYVGLCVACVVVQGYLPHTVRDTNEIRVQSSPQYCTHRQ